MGCVFSRVFWFSLLSHFGVASLVPQPSDQFFDEWWRKVDLAARGDMRKGLNSLVILEVWSIWRHRNDCVFNNGTDVNMVMALARDEAHCWSLAGAKGISLITAKRSSLTDCCSCWVVSLFCPVISSPCSEWVCVCAGLGLCTTLPFSISTMIHNSPSCSRKKNSLNDQLGKQVLMIINHYY